MAAGRTPEVAPRLAVVLAGGAVLVAGAVLRRPDLTAALLAVGAIGVGLAVAGTLVRRALLATPGWLALAGVVVLGERGHDGSLPWVLLAGVVLALVVVGLDPGGWGNPRDRVGG